MHAKVNYSNIMRMKNLLSINNQKTVRLKYLTGYIFRDLENVSVRFALVYSVTLKKFPGHSLNIYWINLKKNLYFKQNLSSQQKIFNKPLLL